MPKQHLSWLLLILVGLFACSGVQEAATPTATATSVPPTVTSTVAATATAVQQTNAPAGEVVNGYLNVLYTQQDGNLLGKTNKAQFLNIYASW